MDTEQHHDYEAEMEKLVAMPEEAIWALQMEKLQKQLKYCYESSTFF